MSYRDDNFNSVEDQVEDVVEDIQAESTVVDDIFDSLMKMFYTIFPGLKTAEVRDELTLIELTEDEGYISDVALTETAAKKALKKASETEDSVDLFNTLSKDLAEEETEEEIKARLKKVAENRKKLGLN